MTYFYASLFLSINLGLEATQKMASGTAGLRNDCNGLVFRTQSRKVVFTVFLFVYFYTFYLLIIDGQAKHTKLKLIIYDARPGT